LKHPRPQKSEFDLQAVPPAEGAPAFFSPHADPLGSWMFPNRTA
jgi:hypothetical protein